MSRKELVEMMKEDNTGYYRGKLFESCIKSVDKFVEKHKDEINMDIGDLKQEIYVYLYNYLSRYDGDTSTVSARIGRLVRWKFDMLCRGEESDADLLLSTLSFECSLQGIPDEKVMYKEDAEKLRGMLKKHLSRRELLVISMYFGFDNYECSTYEEIGRVIGVTRNRARELLCKAIRRLRWYAFRVKWNYIECDW